MVRVCWRVLATSFACLAFLMAFTWAEWLMLELWQAMLLTSATGSAALLATYQLQAWREPIALLDGLQDGSGPPAI